MDVKDRVAIVTGGANGIGRAVCRMLAREQAAAIYIADLDEAAAATLATVLNAQGTRAFPFRCDVSQEADVQQVVRAAEAEFGRVDLCISNAGVTTKGGPEVSDAEWNRLWNINVMSQVYAARAVLPGMLSRKSGYLVQVASAAGLLTEIGSAPYSVTKHAVVSFAEWLSIHYQRQGIRVSCVCPAGVATDFLDLEDPIHQFLHVSSVTPEQVAENILDAIRHETFLVLPHPEVHEFFVYKGTDYDRWLKNFARVNEKLQKKLAKQAATESPGQQSTAD